MAGILSNFLSDKPKVPKFERIDFGKEQTGAIADNLAALPELSRLAAQTNDISINQLNAALEKMLPGYANIRDSVTGNIQSQLRGEVPKDVQNLLERRAAEKGVSLGTSGSQFDEFSALRNLGLTSLDVQNQGMNAATRWLDSAAAKTHTFNVSSMFISPEQRIAVKRNENQFAWQRNWLKNQVSAIPDGWQGAVIGLEDTILDVLGSSAGYAWGSIGSQQGSTGATGTGPTQQGGGGGGM